MLRRFFERGLGEMRLSLTVSMVDAMLQYLEILQQWNKTYNLTSVRQPKEMITRHLLDSLAILPDIDGPLADVGSGAGLPGLPLAIAKPQLEVTLIDSNRKRTRFLRQIVRTLALRNVDVVEERIETWHPKCEFSSVVSRAFGRLNIFVQVSAHLVAHDGRWLAMKGKLVPEELAELPEGYRIMNVKPLKVPGLMGARHLLFIARNPDSA